MMKRFYITVMAMLFAISFASAQDPEVNLLDVTAPAGEILVPCEMLDFDQNVNSFTLKINVDDALLQFVELTNVVGFNPAAIQSFQAGNVLTIAYASITGYMPDEKVFDIKFNYTATGNTPVSFDEPLCEFTTGITAIANITYSDGFITAQQDPIVDIGDVTVGPGPVSVPVEMLFFNDEINSFTFNINFDPGLLQFIQLSSLVPGLQGTPPNVNQAGGSLTITWNDAAGFIPNGQVFDIDFNYSGGFDTDLTWDPGNEVTSGATPVADVAYVPGSVNQIASVGTVTLVDQEAVTGSSVLVPVNFAGAGFGDVAGFTLVITYDGADLNFVGLDSPVVNPINVNQAGNELTLTWIGPPEDWTNEDVVNIEFLYNGVSPTDIEFQAGCEVFDATATLLPTDYVNGTVSPTAAAATLDIADVEVFAGQTVTVPIVATGVGTAGAITLNVEFDNAKLSYVGFINDQLDGWIVNQAGDNISIGWIDPTGNGTFINDGYLVSLHFVYNGGGNAPISFVPPTEIYNQNIQLVPANYIDGSVSQATGPAQAVIGDITECGMNIAIVPVTLTDVDDILSLNYVINYDPAVLAFIELQNIDPDFADLLVNDAGGTLTVTWNETAGVVDPNGVIFEMKFSFLGQDTEITWEVGTEMINDQILTAPVTYVDGSVDCNFDTRTLIVNRLGNGAEVVSEDGTVLVPDAGTDNEYTVLYGTELTLEAFPDEGWEFTNWTGIVDDPLANPTTITMDGDYTVVANYDMIEYLVTLTADPAEGGTVAGDGIYFFQDPVSVVATPNEGWAFVNWTDDQGAVVSTDATYNFNMPSNDVDLTAHFEMIEYTLTTEADPAEGGTTAGDGLYTFQAMVDVSATPNEGWAFVNWTDDLGAVVSTVADFTYSMPSRDVTLTANFEMIDYTLTLVADPAEGGTVTGGGIYNFGDVVTVTATPNEGWEFLNWTDDLGAEVSDQATFDYTMPSSDVTLTANFSMIPYTLTTEADPAEGGTTAGDGVYTFGAVVTVSATANEGWGFVNWTDEQGAEVSDQATFDYTMPSNDVTLTANFGLIDYTLTLVADPAEGGTVTGGGIYNFGDVVTVSATANTGWEFVNWTDEQGAEVSDQATFDYTMPSSDVTLTANFVQVEFMLTLVADPAIGGTVTGGGTYTLGEQVTATATPNEGWEFVNWTDEQGTEVSTNATYVFNMPAMDMTLTANFSAIDYTLTLVADPAEGGTVAGGGTYTFGQEVTVTATPGEGWEFVNWTFENGDEASTDAEYTFNMPSGDLTLTANFQQVFDLTLIATPAEGGTVTGAGTYPAGTVVDIEATANEGYVFYNWAGDVADPNAAATTVTMDADKTAEAFFYQFGDANGDGAVNVLDIVTIANYITGENPDPFIFAAADVNGDGVINILDIVATVNIINAGS